MKNIKFIHILALLAILLFFVLVRSYLGVVILSIAIAFFAYPLYDRSLKKVKKSWIAVIITWIWIILTILIPIAILVLVTSNQTSLFIHDLWVFISTNTSVNDFLSSQNIDLILEKIGTFVSNLGLEFDSKRMYEIILSVATVLWDWLKSLILGITNSVFNTAINIFVCFSVTTALFVNRKGVLQAVKDISPLEVKQTETYLSRVGSMMNSTIKWTFVIAIIQALITGVSFAIAGVPYTMFWTLLVCFLSFIPFLGAGLIAVPAAIILILMGNVWEWIMVLIVNIVIVGNVDNILRPMLIGSDANINSALMILSIFGGMALFGIFGVFYWPIIMLVILTTIEFYIAEMKKNRWENNTSNNIKKQNKTQADWKK